MNAKALPPRAPTDSSETENDRFKRSFGSWLWGSMIAATVLHFMLFQFWPTLTVKDVSFTAEELKLIELPPEIEIPPPPEAISRPATPVMATAEIDDDITITPTTFADNPIEDLPPPPTDDGGGGYLRGSGVHPHDRAAGVEKPERGHAGVEEGVSSHPSGCRNRWAGDDLVFHLRRGPGAGQQNL